MHVINTIEPEYVAATATADARLVWIGRDDRGIELEIIAFGPRRVHRRDPRDADQAAEVMAVSKSVTYRLGPDVPDDEELRDGQGRVIDEGYVDAAVEEALKQVRGRGRPSLSAAGESPLLRVRLPRELDEAVTDAARRAGASRSEWVRRVLGEAAHRAS